MRENDAHTEGKWREVPQYPVGGRYPPFPLGSCGHAVSRRVAEYISTNQDWLFDYQGEDVSLGIWLKDYPEAKFEETKVMSNGGSCLNSKVLLVGHDIDPVKMKRCQFISRSR